MHRFLKSATSTVLTLLICCGAKANDAPDTSTADGSLSPEAAYLSLRLALAEKSFGSHGRPLSTSEIDNLHNREYTARKKLVLINKTTLPDRRVQMTFKAAEKEDPLIVNCSVSKQYDGRWMINSEGMSNDGRSPRELNEAEAAKVRRKAESAAATDATIRQNFVSTPLAGVVHGKSFVPTLCSSIAYPDPQFGGYRNRLAFVDLKNGQEVELEICLLPKPTDTEGFVNNTRTGLRAKLTIKTQTSVSSGGQFGLKVHLGKVANNKLPVHIIFRQDKNNWFQGYVLCRFETMKV